MRRLPEDFRLYVLTDRGLSRGRSNEEVVEEAVAGGASAIQLREKNYTAKQLLQEAFKLREITRRNNVPFIINDRVDVALIVDADGVHLGQDDIPLPYARPLLGDKIIGISTHNLEEALQAAKAGADYISVGSVFPTQTKRAASVLPGLEVISEIKKRVDLPVVAIGGIRIENVAQVADAGADCIAVISAVVSADDIKSAVKSLKEKFLSALRR